MAIPARPAAARVWPPPTAVVMPSKVMDLDMVGVAGTVPPPSGDAS
jgi:hypothetical protein